MCKKEEGNGRIMGKIRILGVNIEYDAGNIRILDSYKVHSAAYMQMVLNMFVIKTGFKSKRTMKSWLKEWKTHNRLYRLGLFKSHTKDCDLEENEKVHRLIIYEILGKF